MKLLLVVLFLGFLYCQLITVDPDAEGGFQVIYAAFCFGFVFAC